MILAPKVRDLFFDQTGTWIPSPYKVMYGGRGGLKSWGFARVAILIATQRKIRFLCCREFQNSIADSVHQTLRTQIEALGLERYYAITDKSIVSNTGSEFIFKGLHSNTKSIKSTEGIGVAWVEEAATVAKESWQDLTPTVFRNQNAEIWVSFNPDQQTDPSSQMFIEHPIPSARVLKTSWRDNEHLPQTMLDEKDYLARVDPDSYAHVWEGEYRLHSDAQVLKGKYFIEAFEPQKEWQGPYFGADWGYSVDPSALIRMYVHERTLYIEHEAYAVGCEIDNLPALFDKVPESRKYICRADSARPETISYMQRHGFPRIQSAYKWSGSIEDGVEHLRSYERIVIHPRCIYAAQEARLWSWKVDKTTGDVLPDLVDKHNHLICDSARYGLEPLIKRRDAAHKVQLGLMGR